MTASNKGHSKAMTLYYLTLALIICISAVFALRQVPQAGETEVLSKLGSQGKEVTAIQKALKERGLFSGNVTGYYGTKTQTAVRRFQKQKGLSVDGIAGPQTLGALGISIGTVPQATESNINLLARIISAEARGEPYTGQVAVGAVVLNRVEHPSFPNSISGVIYQNGAFTAISDGQFWEPIASSCYNAARDAINGWDPSGGAIYYYNPSKTQNKFIRSHPVITQIGSHLFCSWLKVSLYMKKRSFLQSDCGAPLLSIYKLTSKRFAAIIIIRTA